METRAQEAITSAKEAILRAKEAKKAITRAKEERRLRKKEEARAKKEKKLRERAKEARKLRKKETRLLNKETRLRKKETRLLNKETTLLKKETRLLNKETTLLNKETTLIKKETRLLKKETTLLKKESRRLRKKERKKKVRQVALDNGTYYSIIHDVWSSEIMPFSERDFEELRREAYPPFYTEVLEAAQAETGDLRPAFLSSRSVLSLEATPLDITVRPRIFFRGPIKNVEKAHLIPHSRHCAVYYTRIAEAACGATFTDDDKITRRNVLVFGNYAERTSSEPKGQSIPGTSSEHGKANVDEPRKRRVSKTGMKHCEANFVYASFHCDYMDRDPSVLLLPIMTLEQLLAYSGGPYDVCFVCASADVYDATRSDKIIDMCNEEELKVVTSTLSQFCRGIAYMVCHSDFSEIDNLTNTSSQTAEANKKCLENAKKCLEEGKGVKVPNLKYSSRLKVCKVKADDGATTDPYLLYVKSAVCWSHRQGERLLPSWSLSDGTQDSSSSWDDVEKCLFLKTDWPVPFSWIEGDDFSRCSSLTMSEAAGK